MLSLYKSQSLLVNVTACMHVSVYVDVSVYTMLLAGLYMRSLHERRSLSLCMNACIYGVALLARLISGARSCAYMYVCKINIAALK
jgi:hypothetical protein